MSVRDHVLTILIFLPWAVLLWRARQTPRRTPHPQVSPGRRGWFGPVEHG